MLCRDIMNANVRTCHPTDTAVHCAEVMLEHDVGFVPVVDALGRPVGVVTDRDLALRVLAEKRPVRTELSKIMSKNVVSCRAEDSLEAVERRLAESQKWRIVVVDDQGRVAGVVSLSDIGQVEEPQRAGRLLRQITFREALEPRVRP